MADNEFYLLRRVPAILRARDFRLYTAGGRRLVDLWQNGGAGILGHTPLSMLKEIKNTASRGLYAPFPHFLESRYAKALSHIFPGRVFRLYAAPVPEMENIEDASSHRTAFWRPFTDPADPFAFPDDVPVLIPVVPGIQGWRSGLPGGIIQSMPLGLCVLAIDPDCTEAKSLPASDILPPVLLAAAARGIYDLIAAAPQRANPVYTRIFKTLKNSQSGANRWRRKGLYLNLEPALSTQDWEALFGRFLDAGFLLPPSQSHPVILPGILSPGEEVKLSQLLSE